MGQNSKIEWTDHTFNPWVGCVKVSPGCKHCYAEKLMTRKGRWANTWGPVGTAERIKTSNAKWKEPLRWNKQSWEQCLKCGWRGPADPAGIHNFCPECDNENLAPTRQRVFCASLADVFEDNPQVEPWRAHLWQLIEQTPNLDWLLLTKRPENIMNFFPDSWSWNLRVPQNIWFGVSVENQDALDERWPVLESFAHTFHPAILFLSLEPLLGHIDLENCLSEIDIGDEEHSWWTRPVDWVIVGGESGHSARPIHHDWVQSSRDQCTAAGVPFFFKQWGEWAAGHGDGSDRVWMTSDGQISRNPASDFINGRPFISLSKIGKHAARRQLDGREWSEFPVSTPILK